MPKKIVLAALMSILCLAVTTVAQRSTRTGRSEQPVPVNVTKDNPADSRAQHSRMVAVAQEANRYKGIVSIEVHRESQGVERRVQERIAKTLQRLDFVPDHRIDHFRVLTDGGVHAITGWFAQILDCRSTPHGTVVTVEFWPCMSTGLKTNLHTVERYIFSGERLEYLDSRGSTGPVVITF